MTRLALLLLAGSPLAAAPNDTDPGNDWPQYNGLGGDRKSTEKIVLGSWSGDGPAVEWRVKTESGFSSFTIGAGRAFTLVSRSIDGSRQEACVALDVETGKELWATGLGDVDYDGGGNAGANDNQGGDGPRSTPSHDGDRVYVLDADLALTCLDHESGEVLWSQNLIEDFGGRNIRWQNAASPLVEGDLVFVAGGGAGQSLLAFDKRSGELAWKRGDERMTHATPIATTLHDVRQVLFFVQSGVVSVVPESGEELWRLEYPYRTSTAASPVVYEDAVYLSAGYGVGAGAFVVLKDGEDFTTENLWRQRNRLMNHWSTPICKDGYLYGMFSFKKYGEGPLMCVELSTGDTKWSVDGFGPGNVILVDDVIVALSDAGEVVLAKATPDEYEELARAEVLSGKCWSTPSFSDGQLYVRSTTEGVRIDLSGEAQ